MADELETVILDNFPLPPIPGPLPATFFTDIPPGSAAVFSTEFGKRPFRPLPNPVPVHAIRSGSEDDIRVKSCDLFARYHSIAETTIVPPTNWQDLYYYFDAFDLWAEGAGFLFHVLGYIVKINLTKINYLEDFARKWSFSNEARLANMVPHQDMLSSLQTPDDQASFDYCRMTSNDKDILNSVIRWHCEAFQTSRTPPLDASLGRPVQVDPEAQRLIPATNAVGPSFICRESQKSHLKSHFNAPIQTMVETQKARREMSADPHRQFGNPDHRISPRLAIRSSQGRAMHGESSGSQPRPVSNQTYRNRYTNQPHGGQRGSFHGNSQQISMRNRSTTESHYFPLDNYQQGANNHRQTTPGGYQLEHSQRHTSSSKDPIYVLNPQKSMVSVHEERINNERSSSIRRSPQYSAQSSHSLSFQRRDSLGRRENTNSGNVVSDEVRFPQSRKFDHVNSATRSMGVDHFSHQARKISWPEVDFKKVRTVFVTGFPTEASAGQQLEKLFSQCGEVTNINVVDEKFCAFITFKDPGSALAAITQFDGYWTGNHKSLTVRYSKGTQKKSSPSNIDIRQGVFGSPTRALAHDPPLLPNHNRGLDVHDNRDLMRITPPRSNFYNLSKSYQTVPLNTFEQPREGTAVVQTTVSSDQAKRPKIESLDLPSKPKYSTLELLWEDPSSNTSRSRGQYVQSQLRTPEKRNNSSEHKIGTRNQNSNERSGPSTGKHSVVSESSKPQRKTPKKPKKLLSDHKDLTQNNSLDVPHRTVSQDPVVYSTRNESSLTKSAKAANRETDVNASNNTILPTITQLLAEHRISNSPVSTIRSGIKCFGDSSQCNTGSLQMHMSTTNSSSRSNSTASTELDSRNVSSQSSTAFVDTTQNNLFSEGVQTTESEFTIATLRKATETPSEPKKSEVEADLAARQQKRKPKHKNRCSTQSNTANASLAVNNTFHTELEDLPGNGVMDRSKAETRYHAKTDSSTSESSSVTTQVMTAEIEPSTSLNQRVKNEKAEPGCDSPGSSTPTGYPGRRGHRPKKSIQAKANLVDDIFRNMQPAQLKPLEGVGHSSLEAKDEHGSRIPESCKNSSSPKEPRPNGWGESRTPTRKPLSRSRSKQVDQKHSAPNRKENKSLSLSPVEILSDPSNWPALGSTKLQSDTKSGNTQKSHSGKKPFSERTIPSVPIRRDSMASVVSQSTQLARCPTTDIFNSPTSGASPLWPIVKRWDGRG